MKNILAVGCGGFYGASARYLVSLAAARLDSRGFPLGTFMVNLLGAFLIGLLSELFARACPDRDRLRLFLTTGIMGGFTTFSTFSLETVNLFQAGRPWMAAANVLLSMTFCLAGAAAGKLCAARLA